MKDERRPARNAAANRIASQDGSERRGRSAPALVIRLEVGAAPSVVADWDDDLGDEQITRWFDENPRLASIAYTACQLAEEEAA